MNKTENNFFEKDNNLTLYNGTKERTTRLSLFEIERDRGFKYNDYFSPTNFITYKPDPNHPPKKFFMGFLDNVQGITKN